MALHTVSPLSLVPRVTPLKAADSGTAILVQTIPLRRLITYCHTSCDPTKGKGAVTVNATKCTDAVTDRSTRRWEQTGQRGYRWGRNTDRAKGEI
jgi:hypothetical protein